MPKQVYAVGDMVVLKTSMFRNSRPDQIGRVVVVLPNTQGMAQYRVRFDNEVCERRITEADIDVEASNPAKKTDRPILVDPAGSWIKPNAVKISK